MNITRVQVQVTAIEVDEPLGGLGKHRWITAWNKETVVLNRAGGPRSNRWTFDREITPPKKAQP